MNQTIRRGGKILVISLVVVILLIVGTVIAIAATAGGGKQHDSQPGKTNSPVPATTSATPNAAGQDGLLPTGMPAKPSNTAEWKNLAETFARSVYSADTSKVSRESYLDALASYAKPSDALWQTMASDAQQRVQANQTQMRGTLDSSVGISDQNWKLMVPSSGVMTSTPTATVADDQLQAWRDAGREADGTDYSYQLRAMGVHYVTITLETRLTMPNDPAGTPPETGQVKISVATQCQPKKGVTMPTAGLVPDTNFSECVITKVFAEPQV